MIKPVVLIFIGRFLPGYKAGGPIRTIANLVARLADEFEFYIVTLDRDLGDVEPYTSVEPGAWQSVAGASVRYLAAEDVSMRLLSDIVQEIHPATIYLNGFHDPTFTQRILLARKLRMIRHSNLVLAPRGEFSGSALALKAFKKKIYRLMVSVFGLYGGLTWQASSQKERSDICRRFPAARQARIIVARNLAPPIEVIKTDRKRSGKGSACNDGLDVCFLARVVPMKNLDFALKVLATVDVPIRFTIYGPKEDLNYWEGCMLQANVLPKHVELQYAGSVLPENVRQTLAEHDVFFLPTRGENYGHVIFEALAAGLPILISDQTPWMDVEKAGVGWALSLDAIEPFARVLTQLAGWNSQQWNELHKRTTAYAAIIADDTETLESNRQLFAV